MHLPKLMGLWLTMVKEWFQKIAQIGETETQVWSVFSSSRVPQGYSSIARLGMAIAGWLFSYVVTLAPHLTHILANWPISWWRHQMETFSALLALFAGNSPVTGEFPAQRPVTRSFDVFFDLRLNKWLSKQSRDWWFETLPCSLWYHCNLYARTSVLRPHELGYSCGMMTQRIRDLLCWSSISFNPNPRSKSRI